MRLRGLSFRDNVARAVAYALPRRVVAWVAIRVWAVATTGIYSDTDATAITAHEALRRFELNPRNGR